MADERENERSYRVGIICALGVEHDAVDAMLDEEYTDLDFTHATRGDSNFYVYGRIGKHNVVLTRLSSGIYGITEAAISANNMTRSFSNIKSGVVLMVGIAGGIWSSENDIRLGDVVVGEPKNANSGVIAYRRGKIERDGELNMLDYSLRAPRFILQVLNEIKRNAGRGRSKLSTHILNAYKDRPDLQKKFRRPDPDSDRLFQWIYPHPKNHPTCLDDDKSFIERRQVRDDPNATQVFYGTIGSADIVMKNAHERDLVASRYNILAVEMEAAGVASDCQALIIRGVCDYADSHKNDDWHNFAAIAAAAYAKELLYTLKDVASYQEPRIKRSTPQATPAESRRVSLAATGTGLGTGAAPSSLRSQWKAVFKAKANDFYYTKANDVNGLLRSTTAQLQGDERFDVPKDDDAQLAKDHSTSEQEHRTLIDKLKTYCDTLSGEDMVADRGTPSAPIEGTCEWIVKNDTCQSWLNERMGMLWIIAEAEQGINNMSHFLYQRIKSSVRPSTQLVYYLCTGDKKNHYGAVLMLRNVLWQIVEEVQQSDRIERKRCVVRAFEQQETMAKNTLSDYLNSRDPLWKILLAIASDPAFGPIYAVLDALDELDQDSINWLVQQYQCLVDSKAPPELKVIILSKEDVNMRKLEKQQVCHVINLADHKEHVMSDLEKTASEKLREIDCVPKIEGEIEKRLRNTLLEKARDSFVYVECVTKELARNKALGDIERKLEEIPSGFDPYLRYVLRQIFERGRLAAITQILRLVAIAVRPLAVTEIAEALRSISASEGREPARHGQASREELQEAIDDLNDYIDQCSPLLQIRNDAVHFANESAKAFLFNKQDPPLDEFHIDRIDSNLRTALFCIEYIKKSPLKSHSISSLKDEIFDHWPGLKYSMLHWCDHAKLAGPASKSLIPNTAFMLDEKSELRNNWWQTYRLHETESKLYHGLSEWEKKAPRELDRTTPPPLHTCARLGLDEWVNTILERLDERESKIAANTGDSQNVPPLMWAAIQGHVETAKSLIAAGANVNATSTLLPKSAGSSYRVVQSFNAFSRQKAEQDGAWTSNLTILYRAVLREHKEMVETLLAHGADVNGVGVLDLTTCHAGAGTGNDAILELILAESNQNVNRKMSVTMLTPLHFAVASDSVEATRRLLAENADVTMRCLPAGENALHLAIRSNNDPLLIEELLKTAKGYNRQKLLESMSTGDSAIHMAAEFASISTIEKLHEYGADLEARTLTRRDTALIVAARKARYAAVRTLLDRGADVKSTNAAGYTALLEAASGGFPVSIEILLGHGADVTAGRFIDRSTPLHLAARNAKKVACDCFVKVIKLLISHGADVNAKNLKHQTPLDKAANRRDTATMDLLRSYGGLLFKPNDDVLEQYKSYFDPPPAEELSSSLFEIDESDSSRSSLSMSRTETQTTKDGTPEQAQIENPTPTDEKKDS